MIRGLDLFHCCVLGTLNSIWQVLGAESVCVVDEISECIFSQGTSCWVSLNASMRYMLLMP